MAAVKNTQMMIRLLILNILTLIVLLTGCKLNRNRTFINENIPEDIRTKITELDNRVIEALKRNDSKAIENVFSVKLIEEIGYSKIDSIFNITTQAVRDKKFKSKDQFYINNTNNNVPNTIFSGLTDDNDYIIHYTALNKNMFISLLLPEDTNNEILITLIYGLYGNEWRLNIFHFGLYSIFNRNAIDYLKIAKQNFENDYLIDAANNLFLGTQCIKLADQLFQYVKEKEFGEFQKKLMQEINSTYQFPIEVVNVSTKPQIFNIYPQEITNEGYFPMVRYCTTIDLKDTVKLKTENIEIQKVINDIFKGIDKNKDYIFYHAMNEIPDGTIKKRERYGFIQRLNNE